MIILGIIKKRGPSRKLNDFSLVLMCFSDSSPLIWRNFTTNFLHNETAFAIQRHLQWSGITNVILPIRIGIQTFLIKQLNLFAHGDQKREGVAL
jgi:hypothetical protein